MKNGSRSDLQWVLTLFTIPLMKTSKLLIIALLSSLGASVYIAAVVLLMTNAQKFFSSPNNFLGSVAILLLFVISATIVGLLVLGRPGFLYFSGFKKRELFCCYTPLLSFAFLFVITIIAFLVLALPK